MKLALTYSSQTWQESWAGLITDMTLFSSGLQFGGLVCHVKKTTNIFSGHQVKSTQSESLLPEGDKFRLNIYNINVYKTFRTYKELVINLDWRFVLTLHFASRTCYVNWLMNCSYCTYFFQYFMFSWKHVAERGLGCILLWLITRVYSSSRDNTHNTDSYIV